MTHPKMSDSAVEKATGHPWGHWFSLLDALGAQQMSHKAIAQHLHTREGVAGWWAQSITVAYERARGMREVGETTRGFQVSKQKTFMPDAASAWELLLSPRGLASWLGDGAPAKLDEEQRFELADGTRVQVRGIRHGEQIRLGWEPADTSTTQVLVVRVETSASGKGTVGFTRENLPDEGARDDPLPRQPRQHRRAGQSPRRTSWILLSTLSPPTTPWLPSMANPTLAKPNLLRTTKPTSPPVIPCATCSSSP